MSTTPETAPETTPEPVSKPKSAKPAAEAKSLPAVRYSGQAKIRRIAPEHWAAAGVTGVKEATTWNAKNEFTILQSDLTDGQLDYLETDDGFEFTEG